MGVALSNSFLVQLALLETLKKDDFYDEIDLFLPLIAVIISHEKLTEVNVNNLQIGINKLFGITPPLGAISTFLARAKSRKLLKKENGVFIPDAQIINEWKNGFDQKKEQVELSLSFVKEDFKKYAKDKFSVDLSLDECDQLLSKFIEDNLSDIASIHRFEKAKIANKVKNTNHVISSYIGEIYKQRGALLEHFSRCAKGMILANYLCLADKISPKKSYDNLTVYLDTPIIVGLLGFSGKTKLQHLNEFLELLKLNNINIVIFDKTFNEVEGLLTAWKIDLKNKNFKRFNTKTLELLRMEGYDEIRLETEIKLLKNKIESLGLKIEYGFNLNKNFTCDESGFESFLSNFFSNQKNLSHDVICISRVYNQREGKLVHKMSEKMTLFVTNNKLLREKTTDYFANELPLEAMPLAVSETWLLSLFWLKKPNFFSSLPSNQLLTSAYGFLYSDDKFWDSFISRLELLEKSGSITKEEFMLVRWDSDLLALVHDVSVSVGTDFTHDDVFEIVETIKEKYIGQKDKEIQDLTDKKQSEIDLIKQAAKNAENKLSSVESKIIVFADFIATIAAYLLVLILISVLFLFFYQSFPSTMIPEGSAIFFKSYLNWLPVPKINNIFIFLIGIFAVLFIFLGNFNGLTIKSIFHKTKYIVSKFIKDVFSVGEAK
ncbi:hypothetical protein OC498_02110 [Acinetobacter bohemicus]|uniref:hypothetical protein n=1 Tax=Acinetobacter TaxID=469 RepID=UPI00209B7FD6|nr:MULTISPECIES: hypothetical protein [Acinetobacter]MCO8041693.1 hypothetical protein [Acinetobacter sp. S4400-12]MCU7223710.1 hypothetical protein [Acinetobacter bohemicus]